MNRKQPDESGVQSLKLAVRYLARRDRTIAQVVQYLQTKGASQTQRQAAVRRLVQLGYLNDEAFAGRWAEARLSRKPVGRARLRAELEAQGLADRIVAQTVESVYRGRSERVLAEQVVRYERAVRRVITTGRLVRLLQQRGFEDETIRTVLKLEADDGV